MANKKIMGAAVAGLLMTVGVSAMACGSTGSKSKTSCGSCSASKKSNSCKGSTSCKSSCGSTSCGGKK